MARGLIYDLVLHLCLYFLYVLWNIGAYSPEPSLDDNETRIKVSCTGELCLLECATWCSLWYAVLYLENCCGLGKSLYVYSDRQEHVIVLRPKILLTLAFARCRHCLFAVVVVVVVDDFRGCYIFFFYIYCQALAFEHYRQVYIVHSGLII